MPVPMLLDFKPEMKFLTNFLALAKSVVAVATRSAAVTGR